MFYDVVALDECVEKQNFKWEDDMLSIPLTITGYVRRECFKHFEEDSQNRRDFKAKFICPHCGYEEEKWGYDDAYFHQKVIPDMKCPKCGKTENSDYVPRQTKYPENMEI